MIGESSCDVTIKQFVDCIRLARYFLNWSILYILIKVSTIISLMFEEQNSINTPVYIFMK